VGSLAWLGSILAGLGLGAYVVASWPEPTTRLIRLPYGESMPKTPGVAAQRRAPAAKVVASAAGAVTPPPARLVEEEEEEQEEEGTQERELAGPPPVASELERDGYRQETPEELGATPLPGMHPSATQRAPTPPPPSAEG
jgi:hypothetical protein